MKFLSKLERTCSVVTNLRSFSFFSYVPVQITVSFYGLFELELQYRMLLLHNVISLPIFCFSNHGYNLNPNPRSVTPPPADVDDIPRKCPQILDGEKADTVGMMGGEIDVVGGAQAQRPLLLSDPDARHTFCLDDDVFPVT